MYIIITRLQKARRLTFDFDDVEYDEEILPACLLWLGAQMLPSFPPAGSYLLFFQCEAN